MAQEDRQQVSASSSSNNKGWRNTTGKLWIWSVQVSRGNRLSTSPRLTLSGRSLLSHKCRMVRFLLKCPCPPTCQAPTADASTRATSAGPPLQGLYDPSHAHHAQHGGHGGYGAAAGPPGVGGDPYYGMGVGAHNAFVRQPVSVVCCVMCLDELGQRV